MVLYSQKLIFLSERCAFVKLIAEYAKLMPDSLSFNLTMVEDLYRIRHLYAYEMN
jgi:hypothetical protein